VPPVLAGGLCQHGPHERPDSPERLRRVWDDILPPVPQLEWRANQQRVAAALAAQDGGVR